MSEVMVVGKEEFEIEREFKQGQNETFLLKTHGRF